jgi:hypothetical protein
MGKQHFVAPKFFYIADDTFSNWLSSKLWLLKSQDVFIFFCLWKYNIQNVFT